MDIYGHYYLLFHYYRLFHTGTYSFVSSEDSVSGKLMLRSINHLALGIDYLLSDPVEILPLLSLKKDKAVTRNLSPKQNMSSPAVGNHFSSPWSVRGSSQKLFRHWISCPSSGISRRHRQSSWVQETRLWLEHLSSFPRQ